MKSTFQNAAFPQANSSLYNQDEISHNLPTQATTQYFRQTGTSD